MRKLTLIAMAATALLAPLRAAAGNDVWLEPRAFTIASGDTFSVFQRAGQPFVHERIVPLRKSTVTRFELVAPDTTVQLLNDLIDGAPAVLGSDDRPDGTVLLVMDHAYKTAALRGDLFGRLLNSEELGEMQRARQTFLPKHIERERYARFMKSLVQIGPDRNEDAAVQVVGQTLEIVPLRDPRGTALGDTIDIQVLFQGKPLANALVWGYAGANRSNKSLVKRRTDERGIARLPMRRTGRWVLRLVHMQRCSGCPNADWQSYWASYSLRIE